MKYIEFLLALDLLSRYHPQYHSSDLLILADDVLKWLNNDLPMDSSTMQYLQLSFGTPADALCVMWKEIQILAGPLMQRN
ncbi:MAG TPA: hypothetical protein VD927_10645 [Chryseosolibacter sp.]|nr:hypothetical protein [Chryseosolibacter sp.]